MLSDEEKKAYDNLIMLKYFTMEKEDKQAIDTILNLIEGMKHKINMEWVLKIKAKIEELIKEGNYRTADNPNGRVHFQKEITDYQIEVLQSLLEEKE